MELKGKRIIVTGGSLGIGKATAALLSANGAKVIITGRDEQRLQKAATDIGCDYVVADVANEEDVQRTVEAALELLGGIDVLINNAGIGGAFKELSELTLEDFQKIYNVNVFGAAMMAKHCAKIFIEQSYGHIINIGSTASRKGYVNGTIYASSKFALRGMTECWQAELRKFNVRVMLINPSEVTTAFAQADRHERPEQDNKLRSEEVAHAIKSVLTMDDRGFVPELTIFATNPW
ncbi:MAG: SDR family oxidoreductase [Cyclobacteriaceae bacterium]|nr:SDR family oxidoreductase [Cyclobacteriaceae bacterium]